MTTQLQLITIIIIIIVIIPSDIHYLGSIIIPSFNVIHLALKNAFKKKKQIQHFMEVTSKQLLQFIYKTYTDIVN